MKTYTEEQLPHITSVTLLIVSDEGKWQWSWALNIVEWVPKGKRRATISSPVREVANTRRGAYMTALRAETRRVMDDRFNDV